MAKFCFRIGLVLIAIDFRRFVFCEQGKIVGGQNISILEAPHAVAIISFREDEGKFICGSSVLLHNVLLTAGHCCAKAQREFYMVAGRTKIIHNSKIVKDAKIIIHENYQESVLICDIAIIILNKPLALGPNIKRIAIMSDPPHTSKGTVAGWGRIQIEKPNTVKTLKSTSVRIFSYEECSQRNEQPLGTLCVSAIENPDEFGHPSRGDSGSSLLIKNLIAIGMVSYGPGYGYRDMGIVLTNVTYHYDWIFSKVNQTDFCI